MNDFHGKSGMWNGWLPGWTIAARTDELERETSSPLDVTLSQQPFLLECDTPGVDTLINFTPTGRARCHLCARGIRIVDEHDDQDIIVSCIKIDATSLVIEADQQLIKEFLENDELDHKNHESFLFLGEGQYHLAILIDRKTNPTRISVTAGTGDRERLFSRARGHLSIEVHQELDKLLTDANVLTVDAQSDGAAMMVKPGEYLMSRMRPATPRIPHPWLADAEKEPVWNLAITYLVANGLFTGDENLSAGLLGNLLEMMDDEGSLPMAGGNISHPFTGQPSHPLLARFILRSYLQTRRWPADVDQTIDQIHLYLDRLIKSLNETEILESLSPWYRILLTDEINCLAELYQLSGRSSEERLRALQAQKFPELASPGDSPDHTIELLTTFMSTMSDTLNPSAEHAQIKAISTMLINDTRDLPPEVWLLTMAAAENFSRMNYRLYSAWITELNTIAQTRWSQLASRIISNADLLSEPGVMALAGFLIWSGDRKLESFDPIKMRQQSIMTFINRRKIWLLGSAVALVIALGLFLISVQMRSSMTSSIYETNFGMAVQKYEAGMYDDALQIIEDMEKRGAANNPALVFQKGKIHYRQKSYTAAVECFTFCRDKKPDNPAYMYNLGLSLAQIGDYESARLIFDSIMTTYKTAHPALAVRARIVYDTLGDIEKMQPGRLSK